MSLPIVLENFRRVFLAYLEAPNSIFVKKNCRIILNSRISPYSPCLGSLGLLCFVVDKIGFGDVSPWGSWKPPEMPELISTEVSWLPERAR